MDLIYKEFRLPSKCLVDKEISKELFLSYGKMTDKSKERFNKYFKTARIVYSLKSSDLRMGDITVNGVDYSELQIIEVSITTQKIQYYEMLSFARDIAQGISYPTLLVLKYGQTHYRFFAFIIHKGKIDSYKSIVDNSKCSGWIWYQKEKLHTYDKALLNNMMFFFYKSRNIYDISLNLLSLYEKHSKIYYTQRKLSHNDAYYNSHKTINAIVEQERREVNIIKNKF